MARRSVRRLKPAPPDQPTAAAPRVRIELQDFARRLHQELIKKGWTQSDLARAAFGTTVDSSGYKVAKGRDRISVYLRGLQAPDPRHLSAIAKALGVTPEDLAPDLHASAIDREFPEVRINQASGHPGKVHLVVNKIVPATVAAQVFSLISDVDGEPK